MTRTASRSATTFRSDAVIVPERPTTTITLGTGTYTARAPKYQVWWDVVDMLDRSQLASEAARRLTEEADKLGPAEQRELLEQVAVLDNFGHMQRAIIYGVQDETGRIKGGFLRRCLHAEDWQKIAAEVDDDDSDLDLPDLYNAAITLRETFDAWFQARSETMGLPTAQADPKPAKTKPARRG